MSRTRILLIDGDESFIHDVSAAAEARGFDATSTTSSTDGFELARAGRPDLIVVNVELAPTNGWSVCTKLKKDDELKGIPVILTSSTSTADTFEKHKKLKTRADEYLLKPYLPADLAGLAARMVGLPEPEAEAELPPLVDADEPLALDDGGDAEVIAVADDEPLEAAVEDPLSAGEELLTDDDRLPEPPEADEPLLDAAPQDPLASTLEDGSEEEALVTEDPLLGDDTLLSDDELASPLTNSEADDLTAFDQSFDGLSGVEGEVTVAEGAALETLDLDAEASLATDGLPFEEAPLEIPAEESAAEAGTLGEGQEEGGNGSVFGDEAFSERTLAIAVESPEGGSNPELESRIAELEAELAGYRDAQSSQETESERLRGELSRKDREILDLREQLHGRDKSLLELRESESKLTGEVAKARDEKTRREATVKALTTKAEQLALQSAKLHKELLQAREEAKTVAALKAKLADVEKAQGQLLEVQGQLVEAHADVQRLKVEVENARSEGDELRFARDQVQSEAEGLRRDLEETRRTAERALANAGQLQERLAAADERAEGHATKARGHEQHLGKTRETLQKLLSEIGA